jgi:hypothetical protein
MRTKRAGVNAVLTQIEQGSDRSSLFYWMVKHHDEMAGKAKGRRLRWAELCVTFRNLGLTNQHGEVASERTARETWYQARRHVASDRANSASLAATGIVRRHPTASVPSRSRAPASWRPEQVQAQSIPNKAAVPNLGQTRPLQSGPHDPSLGTMPGVVGPVSDDVVEARLAAFRRELDERSGR